MERFARNAPSSKRFAQYVGAVNELRSKTPSLDICFAHLDANFGERPKVDALCARSEDYFCVEVISFVDWVEETVEIALLQRDLHEYHECNATGLHDS